MENALKLSHVLLQRQRKRKSFLGSNGVLRWVGPLISGNPTSPRLSGKSQVRSGPMKMISEQEKPENVIIFFTSEINLLSATYIFVEKFLLNILRHIVPPEICQLKTF